MQSRFQPILSINFQVTRHKGVVGIWDGFFPWGSLQAIAKGSVFAWGHSLSRRVLQDRMSPDVAEVISGGIGGGFQGLALSPLLLLKTRVITDPAFRVKGGIIQTTLASCKLGGQIIQREGLSSIMKGSLIFSTKRIADWTSRFFFVVLTERAIRSTLYHGDKHHSLSLLERSTASLIGGSVSALITIPMDVLVAQFQQASNAGKSVSSRQLIARQLESGGIKSLVAFSTRGFLARVTHVSLATLMMKTMVDQIYNIYRKL
jgi:hypothetical protein